MRLLRKLAQLLIEEKEALVSGDLSHVEEILEGKQEIFMRLEEIDLKEWEDAGALEEIEYLRARQEDNIAILRTMSEQIGSKLAELKEKRIWVKDYRGSLVRPEGTFLNDQA